MGKVEIDLFLNTYNRLQAATSGLSEEQLSWKPATTAWSIKEVLSHLVDHSIVTSFRTRDILAGTSERLPKFEQDAWVSGQYANEGEFGTILDAYHAFLYYNALLLSRLNAEDTAKTGVNFKGEAVSITDLINGFISHVDKHLGQISRIKQAAGIAS